MTDTTKKKLNAAAAIVIAAGYAGYWLTGGTEADATNIGTVTILALGAISLVMKAIFGKE